MANVLYISMTGMAESIGESQVIQYILELSKKNTMSLFSFEKPEGAEKFNAIKKRLNEAGIEWDYCTYSNRFGMLSTANQIIRTFFFLAKKIKKDKVEIIHARSLVPAVIGVLLKKIFQVKLLFDIRGFAIDEKILAGRLKERSFVTKVLKKIESKTYQNANHIVTLTHTSKPIIEKNYYITSENITVIPTCVNEDIFYAVSTNKKIELKRALGYSDDDFLVLRSGSINACYDFEAEFELFEELAKSDQKIKFLILNKRQHNLINAYLEKYSFIKERSKILSAEFSQIANYINACDMCIFFVKPTFSKQASAPTKFAELVACHINTVTNSGYGDSEYYLKNYNVGKLFDLEEVKFDLEKIAKNLLEFIRKYREDNNFSELPGFDKLVSEHFSTKLAIDKYQKVYDNLIAFLMHI